jgi:ATP-dependent protease ClpP protease subunit
LIKPDQNYRANPSRAIYVDGVLDDQLLSKLTPQILKLHQVRKPITLYILNSPGGNVGIMQDLIRLVQLKDQDAADPCRLITVVTAKAQSAAADLLSAGDYAIALPGSTLLYHGVRTPGLIPALQPLTAERTSLLAHVLRLTNDAYAMQLAQKAETRFRLRYILLRPSFKKLKDSKPGMSDFDCFLELLPAKLSLGAKKVFKKARERYARYEPLFSKVTKKTSGNRGPERRAKQEARTIKAIVDFEIASNKNDVNWTFKDGGLTRVVEDFFLVSEYVEEEQSDRIRLWCLSLGKMSLTKEEVAELDQIPDEKLRNERLIEKVQPPLKPLVMFFVALCHALQEDDNELTATDGYWLGLVDEVMGDNSLLTVRMFAEYEDDPPQEQETDVQKEEAPEGTPAAAAGA